VAAEEGALNVVARAADGSMRDALSLLDQAIAFGGGDIKLAEINAMLGTIDRTHVLKLIEALADEDGAALMAQVERLDERAPSYGAVLDELMSTLQRLAVIQLIAQRADDDPEALQALATRVSPEDVQLYYQIALNGRRDLTWCRDERLGFEMTLLRMLAFRPAQDSGAHAQVPPVAKPSARPRSPEPSPSQRPKAARTTSEAPPTAAPPAPPAAPARAATGADAGGAFEDWRELVEAAGLRGAARRLADHCEVGAAQGRRLELVLAEDKVDFNTEQVRMRIQSALAEHLGREILLTIVPGKPPRATPAERRIAGENDRMRVARKTIEADPNIKAVQSAFDAVLEADSIHPTDK
jgi:DNA polymerase-3 subunit gamma/tau